ncbi:hypothetical protein [Tabrizicola caldifontis]|uniref:hypothetical protein n=1 Tax=Tabrizicola caldifontis TaxID=2528036 RepID=UPI00108120A2|nr:hypothetical protein [Rhodobacter sp. YIM 73028]
MTDEREKPPEEMAVRAGHGVLVRARNGDVIAYDSTGLVLRLADRVIDDIALRLRDRLPVGTGKPEAGEAAGHTAGAIDLERLEAMLDGHDVWNLRADGEWLRFTGRLAGRQGQRDFCRNRAGGAILADAPGALIAILGIGGPRAALASPQTAGYPFHIVAPADDIGAVGHAGIERASTTDLLAPLREMTHEALMAEAWLDWQMEKHAGLPLFVTRVETDNSTSAAALAGGIALENLLIAAANIKRAADRLGKSARILAVTLDFALEALDDTAADYRDGMLSVMQRIEAGLARMGFDRPIFVARLEAGRPGLISDRIIDAQSELAWNHGDHRLVISAPSYMFGFDPHDRPTAAARRQMAEMSAAAVSAAALRPLEANPLKDGWRCPVFHLAELDLTPAVDGSITLRAITRALGDLRLAPGDDTGGDHPVGFAIDGDTTGAHILSVEVDPSDAQTLLLRLDRRPAGHDLRLRYGYGPAPDGPARLAVRDDWQLVSATGRMLHRWALPCRLPIHSGGVAS